MSEKQHFKTTGTFQDNWDKTWDHEEDGSGDRQQEYKSIPCVPKDEIKKTKAQLEQRLEAGF